MYEITSITVNGLVTVETNDTVGNFTIQNATVYPHDYPYEEARSMNQSRFEHLKIDSAVFERSWDQGFKLQLIFVSPQLISTLKPHDKFYLKVNDRLLESDIGM